MNRDQLVEAILAFIAPSDLLTAEDVRGALELEIDHAGPDALVALRERLATDCGWAYHPPDPLARRIHHVLADRFLQPGSRLSGFPHLLSISGERIILMANHLSYADANVVEVLLRRAALDSIADRLTAIAGPKVFTDRQRRFSSLCFGTIKVPQSAEVSSEEAVLSPREVALAARQAIDVAHRRLDAGDALLLFAEGTRSRSGVMGPLLPGAARYLEGPRTWIAPVALTGSEQLFPPGATTTQPACVEVRVGTPVEAEALFETSAGDRKRVVDTVGAAIASLLPSHYRGVYASTL